jgi:hypothetical protein
MSNAAGCTSASSSSIVVNDNPLHQQSNSRNSYAANMLCNSNRQFPGLQVICDPIRMLHRVVSISWPGLVTANSGTYIPYTNQCSRLYCQRHQIVNAQPGYTISTNSSANSYTTNMCNCNRQFPDYRLWRIQYLYAFTPSVVSISGTGL